ncbi:papilin-like [Dreissena polymorpha]|uniref:Uncharacterized protein n=1 Tax=Dreissena polymorpha TaxID=45954 RepID=A0A9D4JRN2_DREPO|nr:papilin-like [Dreissena polymorpha]KAH3820339.1 hypothetical protein DPMN_122085 [Dreissena polymorpha]
MDDENCFCRHSQASEAADAVLKFAENISDEKKIPLSLILGSLFLKTLQSKDTELTKSKYIQSTTSVKQDESENAVFKDELSKDALAGGSATFSLDGKEEAGKISDKKSSNTSKTREKFSNPIKKSKSADILKEKNKIVSETDPKTDVDIITIDDEEEDVNHNASCEIEKVDINFMSTHEKSQNKQESQNKQDDIKNEKCTNVTDKKTSSTAIAFVNTNSNDDDLFEMDCDEIDDNAASNDVQQSACIEDEVDPDVTIISDDEDDVNESESKSKSIVSNGVPADQKLTVEVGLKSHQEGNTSKKTKTEDNLKKSHIKKTEEKSSVKTENDLKNKFLKNDVNEDGLSTDINKSEKKSNVSAECNKVEMGANAASILGLMPSTKLIKNCSVKLTAIKASEANGCVSAFSSDQSEAKDSSPVVLLDDELLTVELELVSDVPDVNQAKTDCSGEGSNHSHDTSSQKRKRRLLDFDKKWHSEPKYTPDQDKYLALPGGIEANSVSSVEDYVGRSASPTVSPSTIDWQKPGLYNSVSLNNRSPKSGKTRDKNVDKSGENGKKQNSNSDDDTQKDTESPKSVQSQGKSEVNASKVKVTGIKRKNNKAFNKANSKSDSSVTGSLSSRPTVGYFSVNIGGMRVKMRGANRYAVSQKFSGNKKGSGASDSINNAKKKPIRGNQT